MLMSEKCDRCGEDGEDRRTLWMACFYEMNELGLPFQEEVLFKADLESLEKSSEAKIVRAAGRQLTLTPSRVRSSGELTPMKMYTLRVCKACRGSWMAAIESWFGHVEKRGPTGTGVYIRKNGAKAEATPEEVEDLGPDLDLA